MIMKELDLSIVEGFQYDIERLIEKNSYWDKEETKSKEISFYKINAMTMSEVLKFYKYIYQTQFLKMLKLATMFSANVSMNEAVFNALSDKHGLKDKLLFVHNMAFNRNSYLFDSDNYETLIKENIIKELESDVIIRQVDLEKEYQYTLLQFDVSKHMNDMMDLFKKQKDENINNNLSFLYSNMYWQYKELNKDYENIKIRNSSALMQQLTTNRLGLLGF